MEAHVAAETGWEGQGAKVYSHIRAIAIGS